MSLDIFEFSSGCTSNEDLDEKSVNYSSFGEETISLNRSIPTGETLPLKEIMEIHSRSGSRDDTGTNVQIAQIKTSN